MERYYKTGITILGAVVGFLYGGWSILLQVILVMTIADYITGLAASSVEGKLSSKVGFRGIIKKVLIFIIVAVAHTIDQVIGQGDMVMDAACFFYISNELLSIIENCGRAGLPVPEALKKAVLVLKSKDGDPSDNGNNQN